MRTALVIAILVLLGPLGHAVAQPKQPSVPPKRVDPNDRSINRPPPQPPDRPYVTPAPGPAAPMERVPPVAPPAQPPTR